VFTGLIQHVGTVSARSDGTEATRLLIDSAGWEHVAEPGESISVNGCCLTVVDLVNAVMAFDVVPTTLKATTLGSFDPGMKVNLEHAATPSTLLGGHLVQGHVDGTGSVLANGIEGEAGWLLRIEVPEDVAGTVTEKGSIAVDGVSLTIAGHEANRVTIALVPETIDRTALGDRAPGEHVNLESDCLVKMVDALLRRDRIGRS
jgi:riboflavin synthase